MRYRFPAPCPAYVSQESAYHVELVVARPDLHLPLLARLLILGLDDLRVVLQDVGQPVAGEQARPEVVGLEAIRVGRIPGAVVPALVEGQEPRGFSLEVRAEPHLVVVHREVRHRAAELEELLAGGAVTLVLLHTASSTVCLVRLFFSSKVDTGRPLMKRPRSRARWVSSRL